MQIVGFPMHWLNYVKDFNWLSFYRKNDKKQGLKQGCSLSPILLNFFINVIVTRISAMEIGIDIDGENMAILLYADDAVCESEKELQVLLQTLHTSMVYE